MPSSLPSLALCACLVLVGCARSTPPSGPVERESSAGTWMPYSLVDASDDVTAEHFVDMVVYLGAVAPRCESARVSITPPDMNGCRSVIVEPTRDGRPIGPLDAGPRVRRHRAALHYLTATWLKHRPLPGQVPSWFEVDACPGGTPNPTAAEYSGGGSGRALDSAFRIGDVICDVDGVYVVDESMEIVPLPVAGIGGG